MKKSTVKHINFYSKILNKTMGINVYLPKEYDNMHPLPVLYFLHGRSGDETILTELKICLLYTSLCFVEANIAVSSTTTWLA